MKIGDLVKLAPPIDSKDADDIVQFYGHSHDKIKGRIIGIQGEVPPNGGFYFQSTFMLVQLDGIEINGDNTKAFLAKNLVIDLENSRHEKITQLLDL